MTNLPKAWMIVMTFPRILTMMMMIPVAFSKSSTNTMMKKSAHLGQVLGNDGHFGLIHGEDECPGHGLGGDEHLGPAKMSTLITATAGTSTLATV